MTLALSEPEYTRRGARKSGVVASSSSTAAVALQRNWKYPALATAVSASSCTSCAATWLARTTPSNPNSRDLAGHSCTARDGTKCGITDSWGESAKGKSAVYRIESMISGHAADSGLCAQLAVSPAGRAPAAVSSWRNDCCEQHAAGARPTGDSYPSVARAPTAVSSWRNDCCEQHAAGA